MELRHLRYFSTVAETLNFSRAAEKLRVAQPALSRQIKDLEDEIGVTLLNRSTSHVRLTEAGRYFLQQIEKLLTQVDLAVTGAQKIARGSVGELNIAVDWSIPNIAVAAATQKMRTLHPEIAFELCELPAHETVTALRARKVDLGFLSPVLLGARTDLEVSPLYTSPVNVIVSSTHPLAHRKTIRLRELKDDLWLTLDKSRFPGFKAIVTQLLRPSMFVPRFGHSASTLSGIVGLVSTGEGVALVPADFLPDPPPSTRMLGTDCQDFELVAVWLKSSASPLLETYMRVLRAEMEGRPPSVARPRARRRAKK